MQEISAIILQFITSIVHDSQAILSLDFLMKGGIFYILIIWLACVIWVIKDITNRSNSLLLQVFSILLVTSLTPIFGLPIYWLVRPSTTLFERYYEENSLLGLTEEGEETTKENETLYTCHGCAQTVSSLDAFCPHCGTGLVEICTSCNARLNTSWKFCNQCGTKKGGEDTPLIDLTPKEIVPETNTVPTNSTTLLSSSPTKKKSEETEVSSKVEV